MRIEDIDPQRSKKEYAQLLMDDLEWLGLLWDGEPVYQSERSDLYEQYFQLLKDKGLTYPCYCTRADILATQAPHESDGRVVYKGTCRHLPPQPGRVGATRLMVPQREVTFTDGHYGLQSVNLSQQVGDFIIRRKDGAWAYQLVVVIDDALMGVNEVVRGRDLLLSSPQQLYVASLFDFPAPQFYHLPLLCNAEKQRLSKRDKSMDMGYLRQRFSASEIIGQLAFWAGLIPTPVALSAQELMSTFDWSKVPTTDIVLNHIELGKFQQ